MVRQCAIADCIWSENDNFCRMLKKASVPLDHKWPLMVLYLRGLDAQTLLTDNQKAQLQKVLLDLLDKGDFSDEQYIAVQTMVQSIQAVKYEEKIHAISREVSELNKEVGRVLGAHTAQVRSVAQEVDDNIASGQDPETILMHLRASLKELVEKMEEDKRALMKLSHKDSLTGLANRRLFDDFLETAVQAWTQSSTPVSLIFFDIDYFKIFNDEYGHLVGDQILRALSAKIQKLVDTTSGDDESQALLARYGGEEFAIILRGDATAQEASLAETIRSTIQKMRLTLRDASEVVLKTDLRITVSVGYASLSPKWKSSFPSQLIHAADKALYHAKNYGRNATVHYSPDTDIFTIVGQSAV